MKKYNYYTSNDNTFLHKVITKYPEDVTIVTSSSLFSREDWCGTAIPFVTSDVISLIKAEYGAITLSSFMKEEHRRTTRYNWCGIPDKFRHAAIVARLTDLILTNGIVPLDWDSYSRAWSKLEGHHRLKALQYNARSEEFTIPMYLGGSWDDLDAFEKIPSYFTPCYEEA